MPKVYRVEHPRDGQGPYRSSYYLHKMHGKHCDLKSHPTPMEDFPLNFDFHNELYCGFKNIESLKKWFYGFRSPLNKAEFKMVVYDVPEEHFHVGKNKTGQVLFYKIKSEQVSVGKIP